MENKIYRKLQEKVYEIIYGDCNCSYCECDDEAIKSGGRCQIETIELSLQDILRAIGKETDIFIEMFVVRDKLDVRQKTSPKESKSLFIIDLSLPISEQKPKILQKILNLLK